MRIAILADIHSNSAALEAAVCDILNRRPDEVIVAGDIINRGPQPRQCLERILDLQRTKGWHLLRGNHEDFVLSERTPTPNRVQWQNEVLQHTAWTAHQIISLAGDVEAMPNQVDVAGPDGRLVRAVHASMESNRSGLFEHMDDGEMLALMDPAPAVHCVGHTHRPFVRWIDSQLVVNAGAVGLPFDRDPRAAYAWLEWTGGTWQAEIIRLNYDRTRTEKAMHDSGYLADGGPMTALVVDELRHARPNFQRWHRDYEADVAAGRLSVQEAVDALLQQRAAVGTSPGT